MVQATTPKLDQVNSLSNANIDEGIITWKGQPWDDTMLPEFTKEVQRFAKIMRWKKISSAKKASV